jgi:signal transduction histidine kinase/HAMP domain-containing protein
MSRTPRLIAGLGLRTKFLAVPLIAAAGIVLMAALFLDSLRTQNAFLTRIAKHELVQIDRLASHFSELTANHVQIFDLLASAGAGVGEEQLYERGKRHLYRIHELTKRLEELSRDPMLTEEERVLHSALGAEVKRYRDVAIGAIEMSTVNVALATQHMSKANSAYSEVNGAFLKLLDQARAASDSSILRLRQESRRLSTQLALIMAAVVLAMVGSSIWLTTVLSSQIKSMVSVMAQLADGQLGTPVPHEERRDEVGTMARAVRVFKSKLIELAKVEQQLEQKIEVRTAELAKSVGELKALSEVSRAVSSTLDLDEVLAIIAARAVELSGANGGVIYQYDGARLQFRLAAAHGLEPELDEALRAATIRLGDGAIGRAALERAPLQIADIADGSQPVVARSLLSSYGYRSLLAIPFLLEERIIGGLVVWRRAAGEFGAETVSLLATFAAQAAVAIQNAQLFKDIDDKSRALELASAHKSQFLASMSHELRTPLNAILGFNEMLLGEVYGPVPADMREPLTDIQASGKHLLRLINNVLDLAKIEAGRMELSLTEYLVPDIVQNVRAALRPLAATKGLEFVTTVPPDIGVARGDAGRITQCLMNLAGNALKFTRQGRVAIAVKARDSRVLYAVSDTGIGIPPDRMASVFSEFRQGDASVASEYGGTGLGLSITKKFVEMHGGRLWVESEVGKGSTFYMELPLRVGEAVTA